MSKKYAMCSVERKKYFLLRTIFGREELSEFHRFDFQSINWLEWSTRYMYVEQEKIIFDRLEERSGLFVYSPLKINAE